MCGKRLTFAFDGFQLTLALPAALMSDGRIEDSSAYFHSRSLCQPPSIEWLSLPQRADSTRKIGVTLVLPVRDLSEV